MSCTPGTYWATAVVDVTPRSLSWSAVMADTDVGTVWRFSARRLAVTMTSSTTPLSPVSVSAADAGGTGRVMTSEVIVMVKSALWIPGMRPTLLLGDRSDESGGDYI